MDAGTKQAKVGPGIPKGSTQLWTHAIVPNAVGLFVAAKASFGAYHDLASAFPAFFYYMGATLGGAYLCALFAYGFGALGRMGERGRVWFTGMIFWLATFALAYAYLQGRPAVLPFPYYRDAGSYRPWLEGLGTLPLVIPYFLYKLSRE